MAQNTRRYALVVENLFRRSQEASREHSLYSHIPAVLTHLITSFACIDGGTAYAIGENIFNKCGLSLEQYKPGTVAINAGAAAANIKLTPLKWTTHEEVERLFIQSIKQAESKFEEEDYLITGAACNGDNFSALLTANGRMYTSGDDDPVLGVKSIKPRLKAAESSVAARENREQPKTEHKPRVIQFFLDHNIKIAKLHTGQYYKHMMVIASMLSCTVAC